MQFQVMIGDVSRLFVAPLAFLPDLARDHEKYRQNPLV